MRTSILAWSAFSGVLLGVFADVLLIGVWAIAATLAPTISGRVPTSWSRPFGIAILVLIPLVLGVIGLLEGRLKA